MFFREMMKWRMMCKRLILILSFRPIFKKINFLSKGRSKEWLKVSIKIEYMNGTIKLSKKL